MSDSIEEYSIIEDIDLPLYKYLFFYRFDIRNCFVSERQKFVQKLKSNILSVYLFICIIRYGINLKILKNKRIPAHYLDIIQYFGGIPEFIYLCTILALILTLAIVLIFNHSIDKEYEWLNIIRILKGLNSIDSLKFYDKNETKNYINRIKSVRIFIISLFCTWILLDILLCFAVIFLYFSSSGLIIYGILGSINFLLCVYLCLSVIAISFFYYFIVCYYCNKRFESFNNYIKQLLNQKSKAFLKYKTFDQLIEDHNRICSEIKLYNKFWQKYYFSLTYTLIPINLLVLQLILFEDLMLPLLWPLITLFFGTFSSQMMFNLITASINSEASKSYKALVQIYDQMNYTLNIKRKIKVIKKKNYEQSF
jgi:hypothetical protein